MNFVITIVVIVLQLIIGQILGFGLANALGVGNGWELVVIPIGNTLGVWGIGAFAAKLRKTFVMREYWGRLIGAAIGSAIGTAVILLTPASGFVQILYPLAGAMLGYYLVHRIRG